MCGGKDNQFHGLVLVRIAAVVDGAVSRGPVVLARPCQHGTWHCLLGPGRGRKGIPAAQPLPDADLGSRGRQDSCANRGLPQRGAAASSKCVYDKRHEGIYNCVMFREHVLWGTLTHQRKSLSSVGPALSDSRVVNNVLFVADGTC